MWGCKRVRGWACITLVVVAALGSGCVRVATTDTSAATGPSQTTLGGGGENATAAPNGPLDPMLRSGAKDNSTWYAADVRLAAGEGIWISWDLPAGTTSLGYGFSLDARCSPILVVPTFVQEVEDGVRHMAFPPDIRVRSGSSGAGTGMSGSSWELVSIQAGFVANDASCVAFNITVPADAAVPAVTHFHANWTITPPMTANEGTGSVELRGVGWTHVQRLPFCDLGVDDLVPSYVASLDVDFPNGVSLRAGPYMNGVEPTVDDAVYMGTWLDKAGVLTFDLKAPSPECLAVIDSDLVLDWAGSQDSYVDRWWRQDPL